MVYFYRSIFERVSIFLPLALIRCSDLKDLVEPIDLSVILRVLLDLFFYLLDEAASLEVL